MMTCILETLNWPNMRGIWGKICVPANCTNLGPRISSCLEGTCRWEVLKAWPIRTYSHMSHIKIATIKLSFRNYQGSLHFTGQRYFERLLFVIIESPRSFPISVSSDSSPCNQLLVPIALEAFHKSPTRIIQFREREKETAIFEIKYSVGATEQGQWGVCSV